MKLIGHKILVTGGSAGIGFALAQELLARGNQVMICGRNPEKLAEARSRLGTVETAVCDLGDPAAVTALVEQAADRLGGVSMLVNNAGVQQTYRFADTDPRHIAREAAREVQVNLTSLIALTAACLPLLREAEQAAVINLSSSLAFAPKASAPVYCATKAAVHSFSQALRYQFEDDLPHIRVYEVMPPLVDTDMTRGRGVGKISPGVVALETCQGIVRDRWEVHVGKVKLLKAIHRIAPSMAARLLRNG